MTKIRTRGKPKPNFPKIEALNKEIENEYGHRSIHKATALRGLCHTPFNIFILDLALLGGLPDGYASMFYGFESSGKTTSAARLAAQSQMKFPDKAVGIVDVEGTFDVSWAEKHGLDAERMFYMDPVSGEEAVNLVEAIVNTGELSLVIIDSLPALIPNREIDSAAEDALVAERARLIGRMCSKITAAWAKQRKEGNRTSVIMTNQWRNKIGGPPTFDNKVLPGGLQAKFFAHTMIEFRNNEKLGKTKSGIEVPVENNHSFKIKKAKIGNSLRKGDYIMLRDPDDERYEGVIDEEMQVVVYAKKLGLLTGGGAKQSLYGIDRKFKTMALMEEHLVDNPDDCLRVKQAALMMHRLNMRTTILPPDKYLLGPIEDAFAEEITEIHQSIAH